MKVTLGLNEQQAQQRLDAMGAELGKLFNALQSEVLRTRIYWAQYRQLYGTNPGRIELLNRSGGLFWVIVDDVLWSHVLLSIARLFDPKEGNHKVRGKLPRNISLAAMVDLIGDAELKEALGDRLQEMKTEAKTLKQWRNTSLAHLDQGVHFRLEDAPGFSRAYVESLLNGTEDLMNRVQRHYLRSEFKYHGDFPEGSAESLLYLIRAGLKVQKERQASIRAGRPPLPEDPL
jgi:hypothetical protein